jgi:hypothetical protein
MFIPDPDLDFFTHPGSRIQIRNTARIHVLLVRIAIVCSEKEDLSFEFSFKDML